MVATQQFITLNNLRSQYQLLNYMGLVMYKKMGIILRHFEVISNNISWLVDIGFAIAIVMCESLITLVLSFETSCNYEGIKTNAFNCVVMVRWPPCLCY
jgi:hypothetical protein